ncbi:MAG: hypothetical protein M1826_000521 [Phylliscum demangeonii]|nr:MAG: hypothetical protein M1826_000521 [Phylliscum demangeonii]
MAPTASAPAMPSLYQPSSILPSQQMMPSQAQNNVRAHPPHAQGEGSAVLCLFPMNGTFERKTITVPSFPEVLRIGRQTNAKTVPTHANGYFDSKVLSRQHAEVWADKQGKIWIRDVKSSNGTFVNGERLSRENYDSDPHQLREQDILELGIDIVSEDQKSIVHHKVAARVEHAGFWGSDTRLLELSYGDVGDSSAGSSPMAPSPGVRGRAGSHGSAANMGRFGAGPAPFGGGNAAAMAQQRHLNFWLTPVTIEQIVKKLTSELRTAKQQSFHLYHSGELFDTLLTQGMVKDGGRLLSLEEPANLPGSGLLVTTDVRTHFHDPPAPPPQQPLPEKPGTAAAAAAAAAAARDEASFSAPPPSLRRTETERPPVSAGSSSPSKAQTASQLVSVVEALATARCKIDKQAGRVSTLEQLLHEEKTARSRAEARAQQLEKLTREADTTGATLAGSASPQSGASNDVTAPSARGDPKGSEPADGSSARVQERLEALMAEMNEMRRMMESYKRRAEIAEEDSRNTRKTLAEMVNQIRRDAAQRESEKAGAGHADPPSSVRADDGDPDASTLILSSSGMNNQLLGPRPTASHHGWIPPSRSLLWRKAVSPAEDVSGSAAKAAASPPGALARMRSPQDHFVQSAPYASILGVVALGVGLMAYLNGWQKMER